MHRFSDVMNAKWELWDKIKPTEIYLKWIQLKLR